MSCYYLVCQLSVLIVLNYRLSKYRFAYMLACLAVNNECDQLDDAIKATFHGLLAKARAVAAPI
jgi:hypothetical protein